MTPWPPARRARGLDTDPIHTGQPNKSKIHALSPGPIATRAASGLKDFQQQIDVARRRSPLGENVDIDDVGGAAAYLCSATARRLTGLTLFVDGGLHFQG